MKTVILFSACGDGNWRMGTGFWHTGYEGDYDRSRGYTPWQWEGVQLKNYDIQPTHWMLMPAPPEVSE